MGDRISKSAIARDFISQHRVLIGYVLDVFGFRKGVVVATGRRNVGFSIVNRSLDAEWIRIQPFRLPAIQRMVQKGLPLEEIVNSRPFRNCVRGNNAVRVPKFDTRMGFLLALDSALCGEVKFVDENVESPVVYCPRMPNDPDLMRVVIQMIGRARRFFRDSSEGKGGQ